jgi:beta-fructofuranosidase
MAFNRRGFLKALGFGTASEILLNRSLGTSALAAPPSSQHSTDAVANDLLRPEYHLLPPHNWMNDPNGPIWWKGDYHLFYQLNPHAAVWGDMHWGHAISTDMVHWRHEPIALVPTPGGPDSEGCFSGSAVVFNGAPTLIYTGVQNAPPRMVTIHDGSDKLRETQLLATAEDDSLLRWKKQAEPVIAAPPEGMAVTGFRDPCPWREADGWYLGIGSGVRGEGGCVLLYKSQDLRNWHYLHPLASGKPNGLQATNPCDSGEMWECPDFFEVDGQHCLLYSTEGKVFWSTGEYDPHVHRFTEKRKGVLDHGSYYAPKSFLAPGARRVLWGWIRETRPEAEYATAGWAGAMSLPRVLNVGAQGQLEIYPAAEVEKLRGTLERVTLHAGTPHRQKLAALRRELWLPVGFSTGAVTVRLLTSGVKVWELTVDVAGNAVRCGDVSFAMPSLPLPRPALRVFLDASVIETFIGGREAITSRVYSLRPDETELEVSVEGIKSVELSQWSMGAISPDRMAT